MTETLWFLNSRVTLHPPVAGVSVSEHLIPFGDSPPLHVHHEQDEVFHVLEGVVRVRLGETETVARAGDTLVGPKGVPHSFRVESPEGARMLAITVGDHFHDFVREMARSAESDGLPTLRAPTPEMQAALAQAAERHGATILGPPMT